MVEERQEPSFLKNLMLWVLEQKKAIDTLRKSEKDIEKADRLMQILAARVACTYIMRTIKGFESWLQDPLVIGLMPEEMVREMRAKLWKIMYELMEYDIKHTSEYHDYLKKVYEERKMPLILLQRLERGRRREGIPYFV